jgi:hypothetical protein
MRAPTDGALTGSYDIPFPNNFPYSAPKTMTYASESQSFSSYTLTASSLSITDDAGDLVDATGDLSCTAGSNTAYTVDM